MTTNPRDTIADALTDPDVPNDTRRLIAEHEADGALALLAERGFVVVACPPGSRVVVSRESKPCDECAGTGNRFYEVAEGFCDCIGCGGSGVVEATTTYGLEVQCKCRACIASVTPAWRLVALPEQFETAMDRMARGAGAGYVPRAVALPEETP